MSRWPVSIVMVVVVKSGTYVWLGSLCEEKQRNRWFMLKLGLLSRNYGGCQINARCQVTVANKSWGVFEMLIFPKTCSYELWNFGGEASMDPSSVAVNRHKSGTLPFEHSYLPLSRYHLSNEINKTTDLDALRQRGSSEFRSGDTQRGAVSQPLPKPAYDQAAPNSSTLPESENLWTSQKPAVLQRCELRTYWSKD